MGFFRRFPKIKRPIYGFEGLTDEEIETHARIRKYGPFYLTGAVAPSYDLEVVPEAGFRYDKYEDGTPCIIVSASAEILLDLFMDLVDLTGDVVDVMLESSHVQHPHRNFLREDIDLCVVRSSLYQFERIILEDGCTGIAVLFYCQDEYPLEVQLEEHKLIVVFSNDLSKLADAEKIISQYGIFEKPDIKFITQAHHIHSSYEKFELEFEQLRAQLNAE